MNGSGLLAQVPTIYGAGVDVFRRRCVFWWGTCATNPSLMRSSGAGHALFSSPAPKCMGTCAIAMKCQDQPAPLGRTLCNHFSQNQG